MSTYVTLIAPAEPYEYQTLEQTIDANGNRHEANARAYLAAGKPDYAAGSMRKAVRNHARAQLLRDMSDCGVLNPFMKRLADDIAQNLFGSAD